MSDILAAMEFTAKATKEMVIEECAQIAEAHKSCGCSCSQRIPQEIAAAIRAKQGKK